MAVSKPFGVLGILSETIKVLAKCKHAMTIIATFSVLFTFLLLFCNFLLTKQDGWVHWAIYSSILFLSNMVSLFLMMAIVLVISTAYTGKSISFEELLHRLASSCIKPFITSLYLYAYSIGYMFLFVAIVVFVMFSVNSTTDVKAVSILIGILITLFGIYLYVGWKMGLVVSVIQDDSYGIQALREGSRLVKGKRLDGYLLLLITMLGGFGIFKGSQMILSAESILDKMILMFLVSILSSVVQVFMFSTYTVFYFQCKEVDGEVDELRKSFEYSNVPSSYVPHVSKDIP